MTCEKCGAVVGDASIHEKWHTYLDQIESTADDALERAEGAANVLYQRGLD